MEPNPFRPATLLAAALLTLPSLAQVRTLPNTIKYSDSGIKPASARAGSAAIETRALVNRDGSGDVEVTTGSLESGGAAGQIASMQLKVGTAGAPATTNYPNVDNATAAAHLPELFRHEPVDVQANVRGVDGARTDVVSATATAQLRPDLSVVSISAPPHALVNAPVNVHATIRERNGDTGARANCRLLADGAEVDRADNIWVDAAGTVDCVFRHPFANVGNVSLQVVVDAVSPADWDDANNSSEPASMRIYDASEDFSFTVGKASWVHAVEWQHNQSAQYDTHSESDSTTQQTELHVWTREPIDLSTARLSVSAKTDGRTLYDAPDVTFPDGFHFNRWIGTTCANSWSGDAQITLCSLYSGVGLVEVYETSANAVYHSWGYDYSEDGWGPPPGVYDYAGTRSEITQPLGNSVQWDVALSDANHFWRDQPFLASLIESSSDMDRPWGCWLSWRYQEVCGEYHLHQDARRGAVIETH